MILETKASTEGALPLYPLSSTEQSSSKSCQHDYISSPLGRSLEHKALDTGRKRKKTRHGPGNSNVWELMGTPLVGLHNEAASPSTLVHTHTHAHIDPARFPRPLVPFRDLPLCLLGISCPLNLTQLSPRSPGQAGHRIDGARACR